MLKDNVSISYSPKNFFEDIIILLIILPLFVIFWIFAFLIPNNLRISWLFIIAICVLIIGFYIFINLEHKKGNSSSFSFNFLPENYIKLILFICMLITYFISPVYGPETVVLWEHVSLLNFIKALVFLIGCAYLPGANIYKILIFNDSLSKKFKVEPFLLKTTLYPLLSFSFLGTLTLIFDYLGLLRGQIVILLFIAIFFLLLLDLFIQLLRGKTINLDFNHINISRYTLIILIISFGVSLIALGIQLNTLYLIRGDAWVGISSANYVGQSDVNPFEDMYYFYHYPIFWGYIIYALSILSGLPYVNINAMLAPFCYLYITSIYLLIKALLSNMKEKYTVISTIFVAIFSNLYFLYKEYSGDINILGYMALYEFYFIYKTFAFLLVIFSLAMFIILTKRDEGLQIQTYKTLLKTKNHIFIAIIAILLTIGYVTYLFPLIVGLGLIFFYCIFSEKKDISQNLRFLSILMFYLLIFVVFFDNLMSHHISWITYTQFQIFFRISILNNYLETQSLVFLLYSLLIGIFITIFILQQLFRLIFEIRDIKVVKIDPLRKEKFIERFYKIFLLFFSVFLIIEFIGKIYEVLFKIDELSKNFFFFYFLEKIYITLGFIGILGIYLSYYCIKKEKKLFFILWAWILFAFNLALILTYIDFFKYSNELPKDLPKIVFSLMNVWFERIWIYSIPSLCIFASIGLFKMIKILKNYQFSNRIRPFRPFIKFTLLFFFIFSAFSGLMTAGMWYGSDRFRIRNDQISVIGWASEHIDEDSNIIIEEDYNIDRGLQTMTHSRVFYLHKIFEEDVKVSENLNQINYLKNNNIEYLLISRELILKASNFSLFIKNYLIPSFYSEKEYETDEYLVYYAPYFD